MLGHSENTSLTASLATRFIALLAITVSCLFAARAADDAPPAAAGPSTERQQRTGSWEVNFEDGITADEYAKQLDFFGIELGVVDKSGKVQYASKLSTRKPEKRISKKSSDKRLTISWKRGTLAAIDRKLMTKLGINTQGKDLLHFYPRDTEELLYKLELEYAAAEDGDNEDGAAEDGEIERGDPTRTRFQVRAKKEDINGKGGYEFFVVEQDFAGQPSRHKPRKSAMPDSASSKRRQ